MNQKKGQFARESTGLTREFGAFDSFILAVCATVGLGIHTLSVMAIKSYPGASLPLAYAIMAIPAIAVTATVWLLIGTMPRTGGIYVFVSRLIHPSLGYWIGWLYYFPYAFVIGAIAYYSVYILGSSFTVMGYVLDSQAIISLGTTLSTDEAGILGGFILMVLSFLVVYFGLGVYKQTQRFLYGISIVATIFTIFFLWGYSSPGGFSSMWNSVFGAGAYQEIVDVAVANGWTSNVTTFSWDATTQAFTPAIFGATSMIALGSLIGGEIKSVKKTSFYMTVGAAIFIFVFYIIYSAGIINLVSYDFISQYHYAVAHAGELSINPALGPSIPLFAAVSAAGVSPILVGLVGIGGALWLINDIPPMVYASVRIPFALSFDRMAPDKLNAISRFGSPKWALLMTFVPGIITLLASSPKLGVGGIIISSVYVLFEWMVYPLVGMAAILLPLKKDLFERGPAFRVAGIPLIQICGAVTVVSGFFLMYKNGQTLLGGTYGDLLGIIGTVCIGFFFLLYAYYYAKNKNKGIDPELIYSEIPPE